MIHAESSSCSQVMDNQWMALAIAEARKGEGLTAPNPPVGSIVVRDGKLLGRGFHRISGGPHAERVALKDVKDSGESAEGATVYVTLEPCSTVGRTGACTTALIEAGVSRVVWGSEDATQGGGAAPILQSKGIETQSGVLKEEADELVRGFWSVHERGRPWVIAKVAMSLDGRIVRPEGEGQWLTGPEARKEVHGLRSRVDAIITSGETVRKDDPSLTIRGGAHRPEKAQPWRVVLSEKGAGSFAQAKLLTDDFRERTLVWDRSIGLKGRLEALAADKGCLSVLLESGGKLLGQVLGQGLVDELWIYRAPLVAGGDRLAFQGLGGQQMALRQVETKRLGSDLRTRGLLSNLGKSDGVIR